MGSSPKTIIMVAVAVLMAGVLLPIGIGQIYTANTTGWNTAVTTVFTIALPIIAVIAVALGFLKSR